MELNNRISFNFSKSVNPVVSRLKQVPYLLFKASKEERTPLKIFMVDN